DLDSTVFENDILWHGFIDEFECICHAGATGRLDAQAQTDAFAAVGKEFLHALGRCFCQGDSHSYATSLSVCLDFRSATAALMASSASTEQWILTGGSASSSAMAEFLICAASSSDFPFSHSVTRELEA